MAFYFSVFRFIWFCWKKKKKISQPHALLLEKVSIKSLYTTHKMHSAFRSWVMLLLLLLFFGIIKSIILIDSILKFWCIYFDCVSCELRTSKFCYIISQFKYKCKKTVFFWFCFQTFSNRRILKCKITRAFLLPV